MRHPTDGTLRRLVDEPLGVADDDREHVAGCPVCREALAGTRDDARAVDAALGADPATDVDAAWVRLSRAVAAQERPRAVAPARRRRPSLRSPLVAATAAVALLAGAGAAAAADWLQIFRTDDVAPLALTQSDLVALPDLDAYGEVVLTERADLRDVADATAAEEVTGLDVPRVAVLPRGVSGEPAFQAGERLGAEFVFSADEAARTAAEAGAVLPPPPPGLDGSRFRLAAGPGFAAVWTAESGLPGLVVARAVAPTGYSSGVPFGVARDYLLSLPGMPPGVAEQLRGFSADGTTLPLPLPAERVTTSAADVGGAPATVFTTRDGALAGVVWVRDGIVTAVAGSLAVDEVLSVARGLTP
jgi:hypothetical protein